jgi:hypothetical protein
MLCMLGEVDAPCIDTTHLPPEAAALITRVRHFGPVFGHF